jgi:hypothetical protein
MPVNLRHAIRLLAALLTAVVIANTHIHAQTQSEQVLRELSSLRTLVEQLRAEVETLKARGASAPPDTVPAAAQIETLQTQVAELAQVKVESTSRFPVKVFGNIHTQVFSNSANANWLDIPNLINAPPADAANGTFSASLRQSRLGFTADGPRIGSARTSGVLAMDFFGGIPGFQTGQVMGLPRLLVAFARIDGQRTALQAGQDHMILAPRDPTSLAGFAFPLLFRSGNLYLRAPHVRVERTAGRYVRAMAGIMAPIGGDVPDENYRFVPPALGGERSQRPAVQGRVAFGTLDAEATRLANVAVSGHYGWERQAGTLDESWATAFDFALRRDWIGAAGELFVGDNIDAFGGALGLNARAAGGWAEIQFFPSPRWSINAGSGIDDNRDSRSASFPRRKNRSSYGNVIISFTPELQGSFEYRWLGTTPMAAEERTNHHLDWVLAYKF